jgi:hypothetical protein
MAAKAAARGRPDAAAVIARDLLAIAECARPGRKAIGSVPSGDRSDVARRLASAEEATP